MNIRKEPTIMSLWLRLTIAIVVLFGVAFGAAYWIGTVRWNSVTGGMVEKLQEAPSRQEAKTVSFKSFGKLPEPVARYFRMALKDGQPLVRSARVSHNGEFLTNPEGKGWSPFESTQCFSANPPGFVWDATIRMAPLMDVRVRDAYLAGKGSMQARTFAVIPVMDARGQTELDAGALQRYLAEAIWFPTALLPGKGLTWNAIDNTKALATLSDSGTTVSLEFRFNEKGEITGVFSAGRFREEKGKYILTPWAVRVWNYEERGGMRIPLEGAVEWQLPGGNMPYWKGKIGDVKYDFVR
jgi:uncharacterized protein DUF6920